MLITGGSSGIGLALGHDALSRGASRLTLVARNATKLETAKKELLQNHPNAIAVINVLSLDVTGSYKDVAEGLSQGETDFRS